MRQAVQITSRPVLAAAALMIFAVAAQGIDTRQPAPAFNGRTLDGDKFNNDTLKGKVVLIQFWTTWCRYCRGDQAAVDALVRDFADKGLVVLAVNVGESRRKVKQFLEEYPRACKVVLTEDTNLAAMFGASGYPVYIVLDRQGKIVGRQEGAGGEAPLRRMLGHAGLRE